MPIKIKICGITQPDDAIKAASLGVDALGFIFYAKSPRYIAPEQAASIIQKLPPFISKVGVFVDPSPDEIVSASRISGIDTVQLHGDEPPEFAHSIPLPVIKAFAVKPGWDINILSLYNVAAFLLDTWAPERKGGTGATFDWAVAREAAARYRHIILAGGLGPVNVREALDVVHPYAVDLNSSLEIKPGVKNPQKMREAVDIIRAWNR